MSDIRQLVYAMVRVLKGEVTDGKLSKDDTESVEIAVQCLESAYGLEASEPSLDLDCSLQAILQHYITNQETQDTVSPENKAAAEEFKDKGNMSMDSQNFKDAIINYTKAIFLDRKNAIYYCNRAAAFNNLSDFGNAIKDCEMAVKYDPLHHKAYARMGLAYAGKNQHRQAIKHYKKALELQPDKESYKAYLQQSQDVLSRSPPLDLNFNISSDGTSSSPFAFPNVENMFARNFNTLVARMFSNIPSRRGT
uniref:SGTA homodimerisation domain-containing protein n=1 Tax=Graphocephala atropunctata TaxID=36148 RepID=A0A1B6M1A5_9HEMI